MGENGGTKWMSGTDMKEVLRDVGQVSQPRQGPSGMPAKWAGRIRVPGRLFMLHFPLKLM